MDLRRAKRLAAPTVVLAAAGANLGDLLRDVSRADLMALVAVLAVAADPERVDAVTRQRGHVLTRPEDRPGILRRAHAERGRLDRAGLPVPPALAALDGEYQSGVYRRRIAAAAGKTRPWTDIAPAAEPEPCPSLAAYRRHKARGEGTEECGCGEAARAVWRERKREASGAAAA
jgi:hypothetical protein